MSKKPKIDLKMRFAKNETLEAWNNAALAQFNSKNPHVLFRELIQNSLDAIRIGHSANISIVRKEVSRKEIPCLEDILAAVKASKVTLRKYEKTDKATSRIIRQLDSKTFDTLLFYDNGMGLNRSNMQAILSDGAGDKSSGLGAYGNGHLVAFVFSGIRFVLYAGISEAAGELVSGHSILASHKVGETRHGKDGYLVERFHDDGEFDFDYDYYPSSAFDSSIAAEALDQIKRNEGFGSAIIIPAFSMTNEEDITKQIKRISSLHFYPALVEGKLSITYIEGGEVKVEVNSRTVQNIVAEFAPESQAVNLEAGPRGKFINEVAMTYKPKHEINIQVGNENVRCFLRQDSSLARQHINLYRDGMWISQSDRIKRLERYRFRDFKPFDLVINVSRESNETLYELVRACEGSLHMHLAKREDDQGEWDRLIQFLSKFREGLETNLTKENYDEIAVEDFATLIISSEGDKDSGMNSPIEKWKRNRPTNVKPKDNPVPDIKGLFNVFGEEAEVQGRARRQGDELRAHILPFANVDNPELRVAELLGVDDLDDVAGNARLSEQCYCEIDKVLVNGKPLRFKGTRRGIRKSEESSEVYAVILNSFRKDEQVEIQVQFKSSLGDPRSGVKLEFIKR